jgi:hypothetical protein
MSRPSWFNPEVSFGNILSMITMIIVGVGAYYTLDATVQLIEQRVARIEADNERSAAQADRLSRLEEQMAAIKEALLRIERAVEMQSSIRPAR